MHNEDLYIKLINISNEDISKYIDVSDCSIFHYTSPAGLNGIISNHSLRFTDRNYLNDYSEGRYVMELCLNSRFELKLPREYRSHFKNTCRAIYENPLKKQRHIYQCSFSADSDNLSLWNYYSKNDGIKGYNLEFKSNELSEELLTNSKLPKNHQIKVFCGKVVYAEPAQKRIVQGLVKDFSNIIENNKNDIAFCKIAIEILVEKILLVGSFLKNPHFKHENEYRLLIHLTAFWNKDNNKTEFLLLERGASTYEKNGLLIPYVDIEFPRKLLKSISVSPTLSFVEIESNIKNALKIHGYNNNCIKIKKSNIPVRY